MKSKVSEADIQIQILDWLSIHPKLGFFYRTNNLPRFDKQRGIFFKLPKYTPRGLPDIHGVSNGRAIYIEVKRPKVKQSEYQKIFQANVTKHGGTYIVATCIEDVKQALTCEDDFLARA